MTKIWPLHALAELLSSLTKHDSTLKVGLCHGCFDILHVGHVRHLQQAKTLSDILVVTITADQFIDKGYRRPVFSAEVRALVVSALVCVDYVAINDNETAVDAIHSLKPDIYFKGLEFKDQKTARLQMEEYELSTYGGRLEFIGETLGSSTQLAQLLKT